MNIYKLEQITEIFTGYTFRNTVVHEPTGEIAVLQLKDLSSDYQQIDTISTLITPFSSYERHLLQTNDILFVAKGQKNYALPFVNAYAQTIASASFTVIRPNPLLVDANYLTWYLNQKPAQEQLHSGKEHRTTVVSITIKTLAELNIELPNIEQQRLIGKIGKINYEQRFLTQQIAEKRKQLIDNTLLEKIEKLCRTKPLS